MAVAEKRNKLKSRPAAQQAVARFAVDFFAEERCAPAVYDCLSVEEPFTYGQSFSIALIIIPTLARVEAKSVKLSSAQYFANCQAVVAATTKSGCPIHGNLTKVQSLYSGTGGLALVPLMLRVTQANLSEEAFAVMNGDAQLRKARGNGRSRLGSSEDKRDLERRCFEFDRGEVLGQIDSLHQAIDQNSEELALIAEEGVFKKRVSDKLSRTARLLRSVSEELDGLRGQVAETSNYPTSTYSRGDKKLNL